MADAEDRARSDRGTEPETDPVREHRRWAPDSLSFAVITVRHSAAAHHVLDRRLVRDDVAAIRPLVEELLADPGLDVLLLTGGTGVSPRDVTVEAVAPLVETHLAGPRLPRARRS